MAGAAVSNVDNTYQSSVGDVTRQITLAETAGRS